MLSFTFPRVLADRTLQNLAGEGKRTRHSVWRIGQKLVEFSTDRDFMTVLAEGG
jgi:hypothetical protein